MTRQASLRVVAPPAPDPPPALARESRWRLRPSDVLLPAALLLWLFAVHVTRPDAMDDWGLLTALPVAFYVALGLLVLSIGLVLTDTRLSPLRLALHLGALVVVLHGTVPAIFPETNYPWAYKHMGVVGYIDLRGRLDTSVDIYQNWPGFFAAAALFGRVAGVGSPLDYAKWAPVYFNLLLCLELAFITRGLPLGRRERWLALFLFVAGNWVGQDYFAPQALALVLCLAVYGMILAWLRVDRPPAPVRLAARLLRRLVRARPANGPDAAETAPTRPSRWSRVLALAVLFAVFTAVVVTHQLSPYLVVAGITLLTLSGLVRPRWVVVGLAGVTVAYLVPHLDYLKSSHNLSGSPLNPHDILAALSNPFDNLKSGGFGGGTPRPGRALTSLAAPGLMVGMGVLAMLGALRRLRAARPVLLLVLLVGAPAMLALGQNYGGEAIFRIYLFSLPWTAVLAASALAPRTRPWGRLTGATVAVVLTGVVVLFLAAFYGSVELYRVRPGAVAAMTYFYAHAEPESVLGVGAPDVPARLAANYADFLGGSTPPPLTTVDAFRNHLLGPGDVVALTALYDSHAAATPGGVYLALGADQDVYAEVLGFMPKGALAGLDRALAGSPRWRVFFRARDAVIYELLPAAAPPPAPTATAPAVPAPASDPGAARAGRAVAGPVERIAGDRASGRSSGANHAGLVRPHAGTNPCGPRRGQAIGPDQAVGLPWL